MEKRFHQALLPRRLMRLAKLGDEKATCEKAKRFHEALQLQPRLQLAKLGGRKATSVKATCVKARICF